MGSRSNRAKSLSDLTDRQQFWLKHIRAAESRGEALTHYAERKRLSASSLYEAKRRLRELGVIGRAATRTKATPRFARVEVVSAPDSAGVVSSPLRVRLGSGAVLEWAEAPRGEALRELVGMLAG